MVSAELEDTIYTCRQCGAEVIRTSIRQAANPGAAAA
jgi:DNA-directed RNA polymerase subunit RPC12/RpoP